jgi:NDP-sugar pyrophosphorylase family protein
MNDAALIMAGGSSERMRASGCKTHKALRTIHGISLLQRNLETLFFHGFQDVSIAVNQTEEQLFSAVDALGSLAAEYHAVLRTIREQRPLGTIGAARFMTHLAENVLVVNVDNLTDLDLRAFFEFHVQNQAALTVASHLESFRIPFGQLEISGSRVIAYKEKPSFPVTISSGVYALNRRAMSAIPANEKTHAPDLINWLMQSGELVCCFHHDAWWIDVNDETALAQAEVALARKPLAFAAALSA